MLPTALAAIWHRFMIFAFGNFDASAMSAIGFITPSLGFKEFTCGFFVRELLEKVVKVNSFGLVHGSDTDCKNIILAARG